MMNEFYVKKKKNQKHVIKKTGISYRYLVKGYGRSISCSNMVKVFGKCLVKIFRTVNSYRYLIKKYGKGISSRYKAQSEEIR